MDKKNQTNKRGLIMKALFVGLGSIGQRHLVNFKRVIGKDAKIIVYRKTKHNILIGRLQGNLV